MYARPFTQRINTILWHIHACARATCRTRIFVFNFYSPLHAGLPFVQHTERAQTLPNRVVFVLAKHRLGIAITHLLHAGTEDETIFRISFSCPLTPDDKNVSQVNDKLNTVVAARAVATFVAHILTHFSFPSKYLKHE